MILKHLRTMLGMRQLQSLRTNQQLPARARLWSLQQNHALPQGPWTGWVWPNQQWSRISVQSNTSCELTDIVWNHVKNIITPCILIYIYGPCSKHGICGMAMAWFNWWPSSNLGNGAGVPGNIQVPGPHELDILYSHLNPMEILWA